MASVSTLIEDVSSVKKRRRRLIVSVIVGAVIVHVIGGIIAGVVIVARYFQPPPASFVVQKDIRLPAKEHEHKMNMAAFDAAAPKPVFNDRLQSIRPTAFALPELPKIPVDQMMPLDPSSLITDVGPSTIGTGGLGTSAGSGSGSGGGGTGVGFSFLGVQTTAKRIVIMYDISKTVANAAAAAGMPMVRIRDETARLLDGLGVNVRFGMLEYARNYAFFRPELLPATDPNRAAAREWLTQHFGTEGLFPTGVPNTVTGSPGFLVALGEVFKLQPDVIFIISDGNMYAGRSLISMDEIEKGLQRLQATLPQPAKIHFIGVGVKSETERDLKRALRKYGGGGQYSELKR